MEKEKTLFIIITHTHGKQQDIDLENLKFNIAGDSEEIALQKAGYKDLKISEFNICYRSTSYEEYNKKYVDKSIEDINKTYPNSSSIYIFMHEIKKCDYEKLKNNEIINKSKLVLFSGGGDLIDEIIKDIINYSEKKEVELTKNIEKIILLTDANSNIEEMDTLSIAIQLYFNISYEDFNRENTENSIEVNKKALEEIGTELINKYTGTFARGKYDLLPACFNTLDDSIRKSFKSLASCLIDSTKTLSFEDGKNIVKTLVEFINDQKVK